MLDMGSGSYVSYGLNLGWGAPGGDSIGFWGGPIKRYTANLVQGSCHALKAASHSCSHSASALACRCPDYGIA